MFVADFSNGPPQSPHTVLSRKGMKEIVRSIVDDARTGLEMGDERAVAQSRGIMMAVGRNAIHKNMLPSRHAQRFVRAGLSMISSIGPRTDGPSEEFRDITRQAAVSRWRAALTPQAG